MPTALGYVRVSDPRDPHAPTLDSQTALIEAWCSEQGVTLLDTLRETHSGADLWERPALQALLARVNRGGVDYALFHSFDRFSRDPEHQMWLRVTLSGARCTLVCITEPIPEGPVGSLFQFASGWSAQQELERIKERTVRGKRARVERGLVPGMGPDKFGLVKDRTRGVWQRRDPEAATVEQIVAWVAEGVPLLEVGRRLEAAGVRAPRGGGHWSAATVRLIVRDPTYKGEAYGWVWAKREKRVRRRDPADWVPLAPEAAPVIVDGALWQRANDRLDTNEGDWARARKDFRAYLLRGMLWCGVCGRRLYTSHNRRVDRRYYRCASGHRGQGCGLPMVHADAIEAFVWRRVRAFVLQPRLLAEERARLGHDGAGAGLEAAVRAIEARIAKIERGQAKLLRDYRESDSVPWSLVEAEIAAAEAEKAQEARRLADLVARQAEGERLRANLEELAQLTARVAANFAEREKDFLWRRELLDVLGVRLVVRGRDEADWALSPDWL